MSASKLDFDAIGRDLDLCDIGIALTKGERRRKYQQHREVCFKALHDANAAEGLDSLTDEELLKDLFG